MKIGIMEKNECDKYKMYLSLHHGRTLCAQYPNSLEHIDNAFVLHSFQYDRQRNEYSGSADARAATNEKQIVK